MSFHDAAQAPARLRATSPVARDHPFDCPRGVLWGVVADLARDRVWDLRLVRRRTVAVAWCRRRNTGYGVRGDHIRGRPGRHAFPYTIAPAARRGRIATSDRCPQ